MSTSGPDDTPPQPPDELGGLDPKDLFNAGLESVPPVTLPPQPVDPDATIRVSQPTSAIAIKTRPELPLPEELTAMLPPGAYQVEKFLGQGGMGAVYKGMQVRLKRPVAIKIMRRDLGQDHDFEARFEREAQAMAKLNHPNIVSVIDFGEAGTDYLYIVMELIDGADMMDVIRTGRMTQEMALTLLPQICDALQFAHDHGIVHRDIKPSNIMLTRDGRIKMADFGLAKRFDAESSFRTQTGTGMGTPDYAAPEQFDPHAQIDHRADIYALGVMIYQMITGQLPRGVWKPPSQRAEVAPQWDEIVGRAMQSDPADRYQKATEVKTDVSSISLTPVAQVSDLGGTKPSSAKSTTQPSATPPASVRRATTNSRAPRLVGIAATALVLGIVAFFALRDKQSSAGLEPTTVSLTSSTSQSAQKQSTPAANPRGDGLKPDTTLAAATTATIAAPILPESGWQPLVTGKQWRPSDEKHKIKEGQLQQAQSGVTAPRPLGDGAIRTRFQIRSTDDRPKIFARRSSDNEKYQLMLGALEFWLQVVKPGTGAVTISKVPLSRAPKAGDEFLMELRIQGDRLVGLLDGVPLIEATDASVPQAGEWGIYGDDAWFESVEVQPLPAAATPAPIAATALPEAGWKPLIPTSEWQVDWSGETAYRGTKQKSSREYRDGLLHIRNTGIHNPQPSPDGAIRARIVIREGSTNIGVAMRNSPTQGLYKLGIGGSSNGSILLTHNVAKTGDSIVLARHDLAKPLQTGDKVLLELKVQGDRLTGSLNGAVVVQANDSRLSGSGEWSLDATDGWIESVEVQPLPVAASPSAPAEDWQDVLRDPAKLQMVDGAQISADGLVFTGTSAVRRSATLAHNGAIRMRTSFGKHEFTLTLREKGGIGAYTLKLRGGHQAVLARYDMRTTQTSELQVWSLPETGTPGREFELEFRAVGQLLTAKYNGQLLGTVADTALSAGGMGVHVNGPVDATCLIKSLEILDLDSLPEAEALKLAGAAGDLRGKIVGDSPSTLDVQKLVWRDAFLEPPLQAVVAKLSRTPGGYELPAANHWKLPTTPMKSGALRLRLVTQAGIMTGIGINNGRESCTLNLNKGMWQLFQAPYGTEGKGTLIAETPVTETINLKEGQVQEVLFAFTASQLIATIDGKPIIRAKNPLAGASQLVVTGRSVTTIQRADYVNLDGLPESVEVQWLPDTAAATTSPNLPVSKSSDPKFPPGQWVKIYTKMEDLPEALRIQGAKVEAGWIVSSPAGDGRILLPPNLARNAAVRLRVKRASGSLQTCAIVLRSGLDYRRQPSFYSLGVDPHGALNAVRKEADSLLSIFSVAPKASLPTGGEVTLEFGMVGDMMIARQGNDILRNAKEGHVLEGNSYIDNPQALPLTGIEVINLDGLPEAEALRLLGVDEQGKDLRGKAASASPSPNLPVSKSSDPKFPPGQWVQPFKDITDINDTWIKAGVTWSDGWITPGEGNNNSVTLSALNGRGKNWGVRARYRWQDKGAATLLLRRDGKAADNSQTSYQFKVDASGAAFAYAQGNGARPGSTISALGASSAVMLTSNSEVVIEAFAIGKKIYGRVNGQIFQTPTDGKLAEGAVEAASRQMSYRDIEFINLDGLPEAEALRLLGVDEKGNDLLGKQSSVGSSGASQQPAPAGK